MRHSRRARRSGQLSANAADLSHRLEQERHSFVNTRSGEAATLALLRILALGNREIADGKVIAASEVVRQLRQRG